MSQRTPDTPGFVEDAERVQAGQNDFASLLAHYSTHLPPDSEAYKKAKAQLEQMPEDAKVNAETLQYVQLKAAMIVKDLRDFFVDKESFEIVKSLRALNEGRAPQTGDPPVTFSYSRLAHTYRFRFGIRFRDGDKPDDDDLWIRTFRCDGKEHVVITPHEKDSDAYTVTVNLSPLAAESRQTAPGQTLNITTPVSAFDILREKAPHLLPADDASSHTTNTADSKNAFTAAGFQYTAKTAPGKRPRDANGVDDRSPNATPKKRARKQSKLTASTASPTCVYHDSVPGTACPLPPLQITAKLKMMLSSIFALRDAEGMNVTRKKSQLIKRMTMMARNGRWIDIHDLLNCFLHYSTYRILSDCKVKDAFCGLVYHLYTHWDTFEVSESLKSIPRNTKNVKNGTPLTDANDAVAILFGPSTEFNAMHKAQDPNNLETAGPDLPIRHRYFIDIPAYKMVDNLRRNFRINMLVEELRNSLKGGGGGGGGGSGAGQREGNDGDDRVDDGGDTSGDNDDKIQQGVEGLVDTLLMCDRIFSKLYNTRSLSDIAVVL